jgi:hypothetical protein
MPGLSDPSVKKAAILSGALFGGVVLLGIILKFFKVF